MRDTGEGSMYSPKAITEALVLLSEGASYDDPELAALVGWGATISQNAEMIRLLRAIASYLQPLPMMEKPSDHQV